MTSLQPRPGQYNLLGRPESGYTMKVQSALRFKGIQHQWLDRFQHAGLFQQHATVQLIPLLFLPDGTALQDSTPIIELLEARQDADDVALEELTKQVKAAARLLGDARLVQTAEALLTSTKRDVVSAPSLYFDPVVAV